MFVRNLPDLTLLNRIKRLTGCERSCTLRVLECLLEIEQRKLHFALGYSSLFMFCTSGLGYSGSAGGRRIQTARAVARFPEVMALLQANEVNVCTVSRVARVLTPENKDEILTRVRRKSLDEVIAIVAEYRLPESPILDRVRDVLIQPPRSPLLDRMPWRKNSALTRPAGEDSSQRAFVGVRGTESSPDVNDDVPNVSPLETPPQASPDGDLEHRIVLRFGVSAEFMTKLDRFRALAWHRLPANATLEHVFELVLDDTLKRTDPVARREQRSRRESQRAAKTSEPAPSPATDSPQPRNIPPRVRDEVFVRDSGRCTYVGPDGRRCDATRALQIDHIVPVARGGSGEIGNLRLLCAQHNRMLAERLFGSGG